MNARRGKEGEVSPFAPVLRPTLPPLRGLCPRNAPVGGPRAPQTPRFGLCGVAVLVAIGMSLLGNAVFAQTATTRFVNNTPFTVHIVAGSGRTEVCTLAPRSTGTGRGGLGQTEYFYPLFDVPLTAAYLLKNVRPGDPNFFYQIDDSQGSESIVIDSVPPLADTAAYIVLVNTGRTGGVSVARMASSRLSRVDSGGDNVNAGERGVFRIDPHDTNEMRIASPVNIPFPVIYGTNSIYRPGYRYVYTFDGTSVTLVDARPLHTIGQPLDAAIVFEGAIPADEREALREALNEGLAAADAPFRVEGISNMENTGNEGDDYLRYTFTVALTMEKQTVTFPAKRTLSIGEVTVTLTRSGGGNSGVIAEHNTTIRELDEAWVYRAVRQQFLSKDWQLYQKIAARWIVDGG